MFKFKTVFIGLTVFASMQLMTACSGTDNSKQASTTTVTVAPTTSQTTTLTPADKRDEATTPKVSASEKKQDGTKAGTSAVAEMDIKAAIEQQLSKPKTGETVATMKTSMGTIKLKFFPNEAPKTVENFVTHSKNGYYNGLKFHRIIEDFMIQGGDPTGTGSGGESIWKKDFQDEFSKYRVNFRGALSMANRGSNTNSSQFFIVQKKSIDPATEKQMTQGGAPPELVKKYKEIGGTPHLDNKHTVFGQVFEGMDIVDKIAAVEKSNPQAGIPKKDVIIEKIEISSY